uniref:HTH CENPB-type domain-containing protein n=1 Tax=Pelodiscus sinensis TaxID=13735 RepID=K7GFF7_PELSI
ASDKCGNKGGEKRKRKTIDLEQKIAIVRQYEGGSNSGPSCRGRLPKSTISTIIKDSDRIREAVKGSASMNKEQVPSWKWKWKWKMEKLLVLWMKDQIEKRTPLSLMTIQTKAYSLFEDLKKKKKGYDYDQTFTASHGWLDRFKMQANLHNVKLSGEAASANSKAAEPFIEELDKLIKEGNYFPEQIFNVDETGLFWKKMPEHTYIHREAKTMPGYKAFKDHLTVMLGGNVSGYKLKPLLNYRSENPRAFKNISKATLPVHYRANKKAWLTLALFEDWFMNCFIPEVKSYFLEKGIPFQILFILDNAPGHPQYLNYLNSDVKVVFLPPNTTSILQPMDQGAIAAFKAYYLRNSFAKAVTATECENGKTLPEFWKDYNILHCIRNIAAGWEEVTPQCMNGIWKKILKRFVNCFEGFEKEKELEDISNNIVQLAKEVDLEMDNEDIHQLVEDVGDELSNEDLMQLEVERVAEEERLTAQEEEEAAPKNFVMKEIAAAFSKINEGMQMFEKMDPNVAKFAKVDRLIQDTLACYKEIYNEKEKKL